MMPESSQELIATYVYYICDKCKIGVMLHSNFVICETKILHKCNKCGEEQYLSKLYPTIEYKGQS